MNRPKTSARAILVLIQLIENQTTGLELKHFEEARDIQDATAYRLLAIGEHVRLLPDTVRARFPNLPWKLMIGMRNILAHDYFGVVPGELWDTIPVDLPPPREACRAIDREASQ